MTQLLGWATPTLINLSSGFEAAEACGPGQTPSDENPKNNNKGEKCSNGTLIWTDPQQVEPGPSA